MAAWDQLALVACLTAGVIFGLAQVFAVIPPPGDAWAYWGQADIANLYPVVWTGGYVYPPPMAIGLAPFHFLGWPVFMVVITTTIWASFWYCARALAPVILLVGLAAIPLIGGNVWSYLFLGNVQLILAAAVVASIRLSSTWAVVPLLTKLVPVSFVWYAVRREWRELRLAVGLLAVIVAVTFAVAPQTWLDFARFMATNHIEAQALPLVPISYPVRLIVAMALAAWGGLTGRRWTVPIAAGLAIPALYVWSYLAIWIGVIGIEWPSRATSPEVR